MDFAMVAYDAARPSVGNEPSIVLVVSDVRFLREALAELLRRDQMFSIVELAAEVGEALAKTRDLQPNVVLIDAALLDGVKTIRPMRELAPHVRAVVLAVVETEESIVAWAEAGVAGYIPRTAALADLITLLTDIMLGEQVCSGPVAAGLLRRIASAAVPGRGQGVQPVVPLLTSREQQIVQLITEGMTNKDIARHLDIGVATTKSHVHSLLRKLSLNRRGQVALWARDHEGMARVRLLPGIMRHNRAEITKRSSDS